MAVFVCLGDSITEGEGDSLHLGWVGRLNSYLQKKSPQTNVVYNLGISGDKLQGVAGRYYGEALIRRPDVVFIAVGTNDCQRTGEDSPGDLSMPLPHMELHWEKLSSTLRTMGHRTIVVGVIPSDESRMPRVRSNKPKKWVMNRDLEAYNDFLRRFCAEKQIPFVDLWAEWPPEMSRTHTLDGLHPNDAGYDVMFEKIRDFLDRENIVQIAPFP